MRNARAAARRRCIALMVAWAALSLGSVPPLDDPTPVERATAAWWSLRSGRR